MTWHRFVLICIVKTTFCAASDFELFDYEIWWSDLRYSPPTRVSCCFRSWDSIFGRLVYGDCHTLGFRLFLYVSLPWCCSLFQGRQIYTKPLPKTNISKMKQHKTSFQYHQTSTRSWHVQISKNQSFRAVVIKNLPPNLIFNISVTNGAQNEMITT